MPRAFIPKQVEMVTSGTERLARLGSEQFDPRQIAYVESHVTLPADCRGKAQITNEIPTHIAITAQMDTAGLLVLADLWDAGWLAKINGQPAPILRTNHAIRGVVLPAGKSVVEFVYRPAGWILGLRLGALGLAVILIWVVWVIRHRTTSREDRAQT